MKFEIGDKVKVMDPGLLILQRLAPPGAPPNNIGYIKEDYGDGEYLIEFPIGDDDPEEHSQITPYPAEWLVKID